MKTQFIVPGDVIQANEKANSWCGCLLIVDEVKDWGVQAYMHVPEQGDAYVRLNYGWFELIGHAALVVTDDD